MKNSDAAELMINNLRSEVEHSASKKNIKTGGNKRRRSFITWSAAAAIAAVIFISWFSLTRIKESKDNMAISENLEKSRDSEVPKSGPAAADSIVASCEKTPATKITITDIRQQEDLPKNGKGGYFSPDYRNFGWAADSLAVTENLREDDKDGEKLKDNTVVTGENQQNIIVQGGIAKEEEKKTETKNVELEVTTATTTTDEELEQNYKFDYGIVSGKKKQKEPSPERSINGNAPGDGLEVTGGSGPSGDQLFADAMALYNTGDFSGAIIKYETLLQQNKNYDAARYYCALSYYNSGNGAKALTYLDKLCKDKTSSFFDLAQWQKALILISQGELKQARNLLNDIVAEKGTFSTHAKAKLTEIGEK
jgi:tetratricopeptide (TPR) repeat protein